MRRFVPPGLLVVLLAAGTILWAGDRVPDVVTTPTALSPAAIYRVQVRAYLEPSIIVAAQTMPPEAVSQIIAVLEALDPPPELADAHQEVLAGYRFIREGRQLLVTAGRLGGEQRSEGEFLVSWGIRDLLGAAQQIFAE